MGIQNIELRMKHDIINGIHGWDNFVDFAGLMGIYVTSVKIKANEDCIGKSLIQLARTKRQGSI